MLRRISFKKALCILAAAVSSASMARAAVVIDLTGANTTGVAFDGNVVFQRTNAGGVTRLYRVTLDGSEPRQMSIPQGGSDPDWSGLLD